MKVSMTQPKDTGMQKSRNTAETLQDIAFEIYNYVDDTSKSNIHESHNVSLNTDNVARLLQVVADGLLRICAINVFKNDGMNEASGKDKNKYSPLTHPSGYVLDGRALSKLLWRLRPVALDVATLVSDRVVEDANIPLDESVKDHRLNVLNVSNNIYGSMSQVAFILFSRWISISPYLEPIVSNLFGGKYDQTLSHQDIDLNPFSDQHIMNIKNIEAKLSLIGSAHKMFYFYRYLCEGGNFTLNRWWRWNVSGLFEMLRQRVTDKKVGIDDQNILDSLTYHAAHAISLYFDMRPNDRAGFFAKLGIESDEIPAFMTSIYYNTSDSSFPQTEIYDSFDRSLIPLHRKLCNPGFGHIVVPTKYHMIRDSDTHEGLILTETTRTNLLKISTAIFSSKSSVLVCGPHGSGKSALVRELARLTGQGSGLLELHLDDQTDSKSLLGTYVATDIPGKFEWKAGALTHAVRAGRWVLMEDVDTVPKEVLAALVPLIEKRLLPVNKDGSKDYAHPDFRFIGTCTTLPSARNDTGEQNKAQCRLLPGGNRALITPRMWQKVFIDPLPIGELKDIIKSLHPSLPDTVVSASLDTFQSLDVSGRERDIASNDYQDQSQGRVKSDHLPLHQQKLSFDLGRKPSVRDYMKVCNRISKNVTLDSCSTFLTESQRALCLAETVDIFAAASPSKETRRRFLISIAAPIWGLTADFAHRYIENRKPVLDVDKSRIEIGRVSVEKPPKERNVYASTKKNFTDTSYSLRLMESIAVSISQNEPLLLVGETGTGKTTLVQRLAYLSGRELIVQNMSLQTDSSDLLGGYRPLELKQLARPIYLKFVELFVSQFSKSKNEQFLEYINAAYEKQHWKKFSQAIRKGIMMGMTKVSERSSELSEWSSLRCSAERFERQRAVCETGLAFAFTEGALVEALREGKWILLDEINLASSETLQRLCGLLDDAHGSVVITERGDSEAIVRNPNFRLFAAMNPATDAGKKDLPLSIRSRFTELYVDELEDPIELRLIAAQYLSDVVCSKAISLEHSDLVMSSVEVYLQCRDLAEQTLVDSSGQKPRYTLRTLCRALSAARHLLLNQRFSPQRAVLEGFELAFEGPLDEPSRQSIKNLLRNAFGGNFKQKDLDHPGRRPGNDFILIKPFWLGVGDLDPDDWTQKCLNSGKSKFVLTPSALKNLRCLARAVAAGPWNILLEGPTSAGKTTLVEFLAARTGHRCVRINNHEHTDIQEYTGSYSSDSNGALVFQDGVLVKALRKGYWLILDELNLAPSEVLESLNRLLDDNRELYVPETNEVIKPHLRFRLFATQNPSGIYGGRKPLSKAFRNRFVELHVGDIPSEEMITILEARCGCPSSHAKLLVKTMNVLRQRRSKSGLFRGKDGLMTPRDLLRWASRSSSSKIDLALEGFMLLGERLRDEKEKELVRESIAEQFGLPVDVSTLYSGTNSNAGEKLRKLQNCDSSFAVSTGLNMRQIAPTKAMLRLLHLVCRCIEQKEPVLLVGETGSGKTTVVQLLSVINNIDLDIINCHANTETSDFLGGLRPLRGRKAMVHDMIKQTKSLLKLFPEYVNPRDVPSFVGSDDDVDMLGEESLLPSDAPSIIHSFVMTFWETCLIKYRAERDEDGERQSKRRKLDQSKIDEATAIIESLTSLNNRSKSLFQWIDGPLVSAMKTGKFLLLDEMSLAEDAVLERLNSVLEPGRSLTLAEKGGSGGDDGLTNEIIAHEDFRIFATMNPGGDFGKRELSPALRSRFTEIWIPAITDRDDIDLVLYLLMERGTNKDLQKLRGSMLDYVEWFNESICANYSSGVFKDYVLSLRDILGWGHFIIDYCDKNESVILWVAFLHGASLMHLDGLGLGTGLSHDDVQEVRNQAKSYLVNLVPVALRNDCLLGFVDELCDIDDAYVCTNNIFGVKPFLIPTGNEPLPENLMFKMTAPTTGMNLRRVVRAMQITKPILLEGSPGVGKTSLISSLAKASGYNLVRINLSEQTDLSDLMGGDLPVVDDGVGSDGSSFSWCDGVFLKALKQGDWVLLDELNLASQSVLEGLNSCFDHRAQVFVPELGVTFDCPPTFRVFAAQNPLSQGGGRKGLPKSFLNRFTKVFVEALSTDDLTGIVQDRFLHMDSEVVRKMVDYVQSLQDSVMQKRLFGQSGSPWEFNLRDVFRWSELLEAEKLKGASGASELVETVFIDRFRNVDDRKMARDLFKSCFGVQVPRVNPLFKVYPTFVQVGSVTINRQMGYCKKSPSDDLDTIVIRTLQRAMETVGRCINMNWPCLLVGSSSTGKSTVLRTLSDACNVYLEEVSLTPSSDVSELLGCFEQIDSLEMERLLFNQICDLYIVSTSILVKSDEELVMLKSISNVFDSITAPQDEVDSLWLSRLSRDETIMKHVMDLIQIFEDASRLSSDFASLASSKVVNASSFAKQMMKKSPSIDYEKGCFRWVDGILVEAMLKGHWLHLENVNFCSSSVLDRLNPLMESGGELVLTECGSFESNDGAISGSRVIKPHPNFRLFLSMNPVNGEVSRAMRNRCIETFLIGPDENGLIIVNEDGHFSNLTISSFDALDCLQRAGVSSCDVSKLMLEIHCLESDKSKNVGEEKPSIFNLHQWGIMYTSLLRRGLAHHEALLMSYKLVYSVDEDCSLSSSSNLHLNDSMSQIDIVRFGSVTIFNPICSQVLSDARLLRHIYFCHLQLVNEQLSTAFAFIEAPLNVVSDSSEQISSFCLDNTQIQTELPFIINILIAKYFQKWIEGNRLYEYIKYIETNLDKRLNEFGMIVIEVIKERLSLIDKLTNNERKSSLLQILFKRMHHIVDETQTFHDIMKTAEDSSKNVLDSSVIEVSFLMAQGIVDRVSVKCRVTPLFYFLFEALDNLLYSLMLSDESNMENLRRIITQRDCFWRFLKSTPFKKYNTDSSIAFDEHGFFVQWKWFNKVLHNSLWMTFSTKLNQQFLPSAALFDNLRKFKVTFDSIKDVLVEVLGVSGFQSDSFWKRVGHPLVSIKSDHWCARNKLEGLIRSACLITDDWVSNTKPIYTLDILMKSCHPHLYTNESTKRDLLGALCMIHWASTDEMEGTRVLDNDNKEETTYDICRSQKEISNQFLQVKENYIARVEGSTLDPNILTVENQLSLDDLERLRSTTYEGETLLSSLLEKWAFVQVAQLVEFWCVREEYNIVEKICITGTKAMNDSTFSLKEGLRCFVEQIKCFIDVALSQTMLSPLSLRPYQTLVWAIESSSSSDVNIDRLLSSIMPTFLSFASRHIWNSSFLDISCISPSLQSPSLWQETSDDDDEKFDENEDVLRRVAIAGGPTILYQPIQTKIMFHLFGKASRRVPYLTLENAQTRLNQASRVLTCLGTLKPQQSYSSTESILMYQLAITLKALQPDFERLDSLEQFVSIMINTGDSFELQSESINKLLQECKNLCFREIFEQLFVPVLKLTHSPSGLNEGTCALSYVYLGLFQLKMLLPSTPLDPARKPAAKVLQLNRELKDLGSQITVSRWESRLIAGDDLILDQNIHKVIERAAILSNKRERQSKKLLERSADAPAFAKLFQELRNFSRTTLNVDKVLKLATSLFNTSEREETLSVDSNELNWQETVCSFIERLLNHYNVYEDICIPCTNAMRNVQWGIRELKRLKHKANHSPKGSTLMSLLAYPMMNDSIMLSKILTNGKYSKCAQVSAMFASIARTELIIRYRRKLDHKSLSIFNRSFDVVVNAWKKYESDELEVVKGDIDDIFRDKHSGVQHENEEEAELRKLRERFPDHANEFQFIIDAVNGDDLMNYNDELKEDATLSTFTNSQISLMCNTHNFIFQDNITEADDRCRIRSFLWANDAASDIMKSACWTDDIADEGLLVGAQIMGVVTSIGCLRGLNYKRNHDLSDSFDFHHDPNPVETLKADGCLSHFMSRVNQLLRAFPGHAVLIAIAQVVEKIRRLNVRTVPIGKVLCGLEIILRKSQEWEQHASERVKLGKVLKDLGALVAQWRRLELQGWNTLLDSSEKRFTNSAQRHWFKVYALLCHNDSIEVEIELSKKLSKQSTPSWVWKGFDQRGVETVTMVADSKDEYLVKLTKLFDSFLLSCSIGEFSARLGYLGSFARQIRRESAAMNEGKTTPRMKLGKILYGLWKHYSYLLPIIDAARIKGREPIEKRLKDEVKIAKWDEQSYYSLKESSERSHAKLMSIISEYDDILRSSVSQVLESNFIQGVRPSSEAVDMKPVTDLPSNNSLFPECTPLDVEAPRNSGNHRTCFIHLTLEKRKWFVEENPDHRLREYKLLRNLPKYSKKLSKIIRTCQTETSWAQKGNQETSELCDNVFDRISFLRQKTATKPIKQRALVDLFKSLKQQGFSSMKWSVPNQLREMFHILQVPFTELFNLNLKENDAVFDNSEKYFHRCLIETQRLRSEIAIFGSQYMSPREMKLMIGYSEHGLLMLTQQKCLIDDIAKKISNAYKILSSFDFETPACVPLSQSRLSNLIRDFDDSLLKVLEGIRQLLLLTKSSHPFLTLKRDILRDTIVIIESCETRIASVSKGVSKITSFIVFRAEHLHEVENCKTIIDEVIQDLKQSMSTCHDNNILDSNVFAPTLLVLQEASKFVSKFNQITNEPKTEALKNVFLENCFNALSALTETSLLAAQAIHKYSDHKHEKSVKTESEEASDQNEKGIWDIHRTVVEEWNEIQLDRLMNMLENTVSHVISLSDQNSMDKNQCSAYFNMTSDTCSFLLQFIELCRTRLHELILFHRSSGKLIYILLRIYRNLVAKGYCADDVEDGEGNGEGEISNMKFEDDVEGTGMGEGDGKNDVSDQIENEEQLLGLKNEEDTNQESKDKENQEIDEEEAEKGMEMEGNFDGDMFDVPEPDKNEEKEEGEEEELDREMGDGSDPNENIVDEKMWDESEDEEDDTNQREEKFEKDSKMKDSEVMEDEMRTRDEDESPNGKKDEQDPTSSQQENDNVIDKESEEEKREDEKDDNFNDDTEDKYEENAGVDVRDERMDNEGDADDQDENDDMSLDDNLNLDGVDAEENDEEDGESNFKDEQNIEDETKDDGDDDTVDNDEDSKEADDNADPDEGIDALNPSSGNAVDDNGNEDDQSLSEDIPSDSEEPVTKTSDLPQREEQEVHGVSALEGKSNIMDNDKDDEDDELGQNDDGPGEGEDEKVDMRDKEETPNSSNQNETGDGEWNRSSSESKTQEHQNKRGSVAPNPFDNPGDAEKFWHDKLNMVNKDEENTDKTDKDEDDQNGKDDANTNGTFEFTQGNETTTTQVLGDVTEEEAINIEKDENVNEDKNVPENEDFSETLESETKKEEETSKSDRQTKSSTHEQNFEKLMDNDSLNEDENINIESMSVTDDIIEHNLEDDIDDYEPQNKIITDLEQLHVNDGSLEANLDDSKQMRVFEKVLNNIGQNDRTRWAQINAETNSIARRLCEKLRLVMEPLVATKLQGDYRTGKRINMKRVISYIASGFRKDKIWLRRTKPAKRDYRVLLAVDNSESMQKSGAGDMALHALATLANGMSQLEIGELGVASFGEDMKLLHPFERPWINESGVNVMNNLTFHEKRTRIALCVEHSFFALENASNSSTSQQLVFILSDGRIERDNRSELRRLIREMTERNILVVMIVVEGKGKGKKDSILYTKEVTFEKGKPRVKQFMDDYPFAYYLILEDMSSLPEVLGDALRQWFEMLSHQI